MLIINGSAELMREHENYIKGSRHEFNMFSLNMPLENQLVEIEQYLVSRGWDNIEVHHNGIVDNADEITHQVLRQAYEKALRTGFSVTLNNAPLL
jgi:hypothetical protein